MKLVMGLCTMAGLLAATQALRDSDPTRPARPPFADFDDVPPNPKAPPTGARAMLWSLRMALETARITLETNEMLLQMYQQELTLPPQRRLLKVTPQRVQELKDAVAKDRRDIERLKKEIAQAEAKAKKPAKK
jgi:hypothetical protein